MAPTEAEVVPETVPQNRSRAGISRKPRDARHQRLVGGLVGEGWSLKGWRDGVYTMLRNLGALTGEQDAWMDVPEILDDFKKTRLIPDAWRIVVEGKQQGWLHNVLVIEFMEVEVTHPLPAEKVAMYDNLWWALDYTEYLYFRLWKMDATGYRTEFYDPPNRPTVTGRYPLRASVV